MAIWTVPPVIGVGLPQAGPSEVLMTVPRSVRASSDRSDVPAAAVPFLQSTASGLFTEAVHRPSFRWASQVTALSPTTCAQSDPHRLTVHIVGAVPGAPPGVIPPVRVTLCTCRASDLGPRRAGQADGYRTQQRDRGNCPIDFHALPLSSSHA